MLVKKIDPISGKVLKHNKTLLFSAAQGYIRPKEHGSQWWLTTTTIWNCDELIGRRIRDWRRLTQEDGHTGTRAQTMRADHDSIFTGTFSVFPIPLAEWVIMRYGGTPGSTILDAFTGGPPRSIVSAFMGYKYIGYEIRKDQIEENLRIVDNLGLSGSIEYRLGDGTLMQDCEPNSCDMGFSCPPYFDLEIYSDLPNDLSNLGSYEEFDESMNKCIQAYFKALKPGALLCLVVGNFRDKKTSELNDFRGDTVYNARMAGFTFFQDIVLSKNFASAACRSTNAWRGRKLVPRHEYLLVFQKPIKGQKNQPRK